MSLCNFKHFIAAAILIGMVSVQSLPVQRMTRSSPSASSADELPIVIAPQIRLNLVNTTTESRGLFPVWWSASSLAEEDILKAQVSRPVDLVRACVDSYVITYNEHCSINVWNRKCVEVECSTSTLIRNPVREIVMAT